MENLGNNVPLVLDATDRSYTRVVFEPLKPPLNQEWNLVQDLINTEIQNIANVILQSGFVQVGAMNGRPAGVTSDLWSNVIEIVNPYCVINGQFLFVGGGTNQFQTNTTNTIWSLLSGLDTQTMFILNSVPATGARDDLVFLEVWEEILTPTSNVAKYGNSQYGGTNFSNDLIDPNIKKETTERTQLKYRYRTSKGIDFISFREGVDDPSVFAQGAMSTVSSYTFSKTPQGHYVAGNGDQASITALGTVDGYVYALPIASIHRKNSQAFNNLTNPNGSATPISVGTSDRPDGAFQDDIALVDIEDLRHTISPTESVSQIIQQNLDLLLDSAPNRRVLGTNTTLFSNTDMQVDGISATIRNTGNGDSLYRRPNGYQRSFSENEITQRTVFYDSSPSLDVNGYYELAPPIFYTVVQTVEFQSLNPFVGGVLIPVVKNATTLAVIAPDLTVGINGWLNLGDRLNKAPALFTPNSPLDILNAPALIVDYDLVIPSGTGFSQVPTQFFTISNDVNGGFVQFTPDDTPVTTTLSRVTNGFTDSQTVYPVSTFMALTQTYLTGTSVISYNVAGTGNPFITIPASVYGQTVISVYRVQNVTTLLDIPLGIAGNQKVVLNTDGSFTVNFSGYFPQASNTVLVTLLLGGVECQAVQANAGLQNFLKAQYITIATTGASSYTINTVNNINKIEFVYGVAGLQETSALNHIAYVGPVGSASSLVPITISGLGTDTMVFTFNPTPALGQQISIPVIGTYAPIPTDQYTVTYDYVPYQGLSNLLTVGAQMQAEVIYVSDKAMVSTNGTGGVQPSNTVASTTMFPINSIDTDDLFENQAVPTPRDQAVSAVKYLDYQYDYALGTSFLKPGDLLTLTKQALGAPKYPARGCSIDAPSISYRVESLVYPVTEDLSLQATGSNQVFQLQFPVMNVYDTYTVALSFQLQGTASFNSGSRSVQGVGATFTEQLVPGCFIRPQNTTPWYQVQSITDDNNLVLRSSYSGSTNTAPFDIFLPNIQVFQNGTNLGPSAFTVVLGKEGIIALNFAPAPTDTITVSYRTGLNTMNGIYGLARGVGGSLDGELLLFTLTTTSSVQFVANPEFNLLALGRANTLIFNNTVSIDSTVGSMNEGNRVVIAADFFYTKFRKLSLNQT